MVIDVDEKVDERQEWFNIQEVANILNTPASSVRRYAGQFSVYLRMKKKVIRISFTMNRLKL